MRAKGSTPTIGVEIAADAVRAVLSVRGRVRGVCEVPRSGLSLDEACRRVGRWSERASVVGRARCVITPPEETLVSTVLELPPRSSGAPIESIAAAELARGQAGAEMEVAAWELPMPARSVRGAHEYLVVGGARGTILQAVHALGDAGCEVDLVDAPVTAAHRADPEPGRLLVELGSRSMRVHLLSGGTPRFSHVAPLVAGDRPEQMLVEQIDRCAAYVASRLPGEEITGVTLLGPGARDGSMADRVRSEFDADVRVWQPQPAGGPVAGVDAGFGLAVGLSRAAVVRPWLRLPVLTGRAA
jgi:hypothetical protein